LPQTPSLPVAQNLIEALDVEELDRDLFRGPVTENTSGRLSLYGGQVAGQALRAAGLTVHPERAPHSLHGYFLRPGKVDRPVILRVSRDRDGRSFSSRRVVAVQEGDVIFSMLASFHVQEESGSYEADGPDGVAAPEDLRTGWQALFLEVRDVKGTGAVDVTQRASDRMWVRVPTRMPDDRLLHACALAYISDLGTGFGRLAIEGLPAGGPSIDHAVWFQQDVRADEWVLLDLWPMKAGAARGVYLGTLRGRDGALAAMLAQEMLLRPPSA
jgi:acyl-CoA thioesterase-2